VNTDANAVPAVPTPAEPANPAKGNQQGQRTLAAKVDRWSALSDNLLPYIDQLPHLKDTFTEFQAKLASAKTLRNLLKKLRADSGDAMTQRNEMLAGGEDLYTRLSLGLQSLHGPTSDRLHEFGLKPKKKSARQPVVVSITPTVPPTPNPEVK
jgi:hypothetical protein